MFVATKLDLKFCPKNVVLLLLTMKYIEVSPLIDMSSPMS